MELLFALLVLLLVTRICSEIAVRLKQPAMVGELLGGVLIGLVIAWYSDPPEILARFNTDETFQAVLDLAIFFLMLLAGIEMRPRDLAKASGKAIPIAVVGMIVPLALGFGLGWFWLPESDWRFAQSLFIGVALAITAVPVAVKVLLDMDQLQSKVGQVIIAAAVMDDVLSLVLLAVLTAMISTTEELTASTLLMIGLNTLIFFVIVWIVGRYVLPRTAGILNRFKLEHADFSLLLIMGLGFSVLAEALGMHFLIGAFASGVLFSRNVVGEKTHHKLETYTEAITLGLLAPVFFASIGMHLKLSAVTEAPIFLICLLLAATAGKFVGSGLTARLTGFTNSQSLAIGSAMNARGAVEIIIADIALRAGLFEHPSPTPPAIEYLFSAIVIMAIVTTLISPLALRALLPGGKS